MRVLLTGGAGYLGSHVALALAEAGHQPVIYDNLSTGHRSAALDFPLVEADVGDRETMLRTLVDHGIEAVLHFAASSWWAIPFGSRAPTTTPTS